MTTRRSSGSCRVPAPASSGAPPPKSPGRLDLPESGTFPSRNEAARAPQGRPPSDPTARLAHRLQARVLRPGEAARARGSLGTMSIPDDVLLLPDGSAIASYEGEPLLRYRSLAHLCRAHGLSADELEEC